MRPFASIRHGLAAGITLANHAQFTEGLAVARRITAVLRGERLIRALALGQRIQEGFESRLHAAAHRGLAKRVVRHHVGVELATPVDQAIATRVGHEHIKARTAVCQVFP